MTEAAAFVRAGAPAWAGTLLAGLELVREGDVALIQGLGFIPIHMRPLAADAIATAEPIDADGASLSGYVCAMSATAHLLTL